jgi:hypothetical protein
LWRLETIAKRASYAGCVALSKTRPSHAARFWFIACGHEAIGLKTYRGPKRKAQPGAQSTASLCSRPLSPVEPPAESRLRFQRVTSARGAVPIAPVSPRIPHQQGILQEILVIQALKAGFGSKNGCIAALFELPDDETGELFRLEITTARSPIMSAGTIASASLSGQIGYGLQELR